MSIEFLDTEAVLAIHKIVIEKSPIPNEDPNLKSFNLLESAVNGVRQTFGGQLLNSTIYDQAAAYLFSLSNNHAFENGNKRTALRVTIDFLRINGYRLNLSQEEAVQLTVDAAAGTIKKQDIVEIFRNGGIQ